MVKITKEEMLYLRSCGYKFGDALHRTVHNRAYYATEYKGLLRRLEKYRKQHTVLSLTAR